MAFDLKTGELITIIGWPVTFALGVAATIIAQKFTKQRKRISWSLVNESALLSEETLQELTEGFHVPLKIIVKGNEETNLSTLRGNWCQSLNCELNFPLFTIQALTP
jgi:hypothetical protein